MADENGEPTIIETDVDSYAHCIEVVKHMKDRYFMGMSSFGTVEDAKILARALYLLERERMEASR